MDTNKSAAQGSNVQNQRAVQQFPQNKSYVKNRMGEGRLDVQNHEEVFNDQIDTDYHYNSHKETFKTPTTTSVLHKKHFENNDSESNFDDGSSCASDSAIGM